MRDAASLDRRLLVTLLLVVVALGALYAFGLLLSPFLVPIAWAMCLVTVTGGFYRRLAKRTGRPRLSALLMTIGTAVFLVGPIAYVGATLVREAIALTTKASVVKPKVAPVPAPVPVPVPADGAADGEPAAKTLDAWDQFFADHTTLDTVRRQIDDRLGAFQTDVRSVKDAALGLLGQPFQAGALGVLKGALSTAFGFLVMLATLFCLYRDGHRIREFVVELVPMDAEKTIRVLDTLRATAFAAIVGGLASAILQGVLGGIAFVIVGVSAPVLWGFVMACLSLLPIGGSAFVWAPVMVYQFATDHSGRGWFLAIWGVVLMGMSDNLVRPTLMRRAGASTIHPLLLFFGIFSGIGLFGMSGIVFGPLLTALVLVVGSLYRETLGNKGTKPAVPTTGMM